VTADRQVQVRLEHVPGCPLADRLRSRLHRALAATGISAVVDDVTGDYPSPTLLIDGIDAVTGRPASGAPRCRLDLPSAEQITTGLLRGAAR
jgi:hypothetical protein